MYEYTEAHNARDDALDGDDEYTDAQNAGDDALDGDDEYTDAQNVGDDALDAVNVSCGMSLLGDDECIDAQNVGDDALDGVNVSYGMSLLGDDECIDAQNAGDDALDGVNVSCDMDITCPKSDNARKEASRKEDDTLYKSMLNLEHCCICPDMFDPEDQGAKSFVFVRDLAAMVNEMEDIMCAKGFH